ncbi:MAG: tryptophan 2,3-dioxygenase [Taibaiella sp.]|nr:tryptophan 2,3-dioxygenase [Taibaiella sp.]
MEPKNRAPVYYSDYLQLDKILTAQTPESGKEGIKADDEMLFIIIHQAYELWFKQILHELDIVRAIFIQPNIHNNAPDMYNTVHRLKRICKILEIAVSQMSVMETMTPLDFLDFRDLLRPASGFQSIQFKMIEAGLGLEFDDRFGKGYYLSQLKEEDLQKVKKAETELSLATLINKWLERMPFIQSDKYWQKSSGKKSFWSLYREAYVSSLLPQEQNNVVAFDMLFRKDVEYPKERKFSREANRSALFIMLYRDYPLLHMPYELLSTLLEIDELLGLWRYRHIHMVQRTIGKRVGTGGSTGTDYLKSAADSHAIFKELAEFTSYLMPRQYLPELPENIVEHLGYSFQA